MVQLRRMLLNNGLLHDCSVLFYIDDWIIMGASEQLVRNKMAAFDKAMSELGLSLASH
jgi:hypothetical protein